MNYTLYTPFNFLLHQPDSVPQSKTMTCISKSCSGATLIKQQVNICHSNFLKPYSSLDSTRLEKNIALILNLWLTSSILLSAWRRLRYKWPIIRKFRKTRHPFFPPVRACYFSIPGKSQVQRLERPNIYLPPVIRVSLTTMTSFTAQL